MELTEKAKPPTHHDYYLHMHVSGPSEEGKTTQGHREHTSVTIPLKAPAGKKGKRQHPDEAWRTSALKSSFKKVKRGAISWKTFDKPDGSEAVVPVKGNIKLHSYSFSFLPKSEAISSSVEGGNSMKQAHPSKLRREKPKVKKKKPLKEHYRSLEGVYAAMQTGDLEIIGTQQQIDEANKDDEFSLEVIEEGFIKKLLGMEKKEQPSLFGSAVYNQTTSEFGGHIYLPARPHKDEDLSYPDNTGMGLHKMNIRGMQHHEDMKWNAKTNTDEFKYAKGGKGNNTLYHHLNRYLTTHTEPRKGASQPEVEEHAHRLATDISRAIVTKQSIAHKELEPHEVEHHLGAMQHHKTEMEKALKERDISQGVFNDYKASFDPNSPHFNKARVRALGYGPNHPGIEKTADARSMRFQLNKSQMAVNKHQEHYKYHRDKLASQRAFKDIIGDDSMSEEKKIIADPKVAMYAQIIKEQIMATRPTTGTMRTSLAPAKPGTIASRTSKPGGSGVPPIKPGMGATSSTTPRMNAMKPGVRKI